MQPDEAASVEQSTRGLLRDHEVLALDGGVLLEGAEQLGQAGGGEVAMPAAREAARLDALAGQPRAERLEPRGGDVQRGGVARAQHRLDARRADLEGEGRGEAAYEDCLGPREEEL